MALTDKEISALYFEALGSQHLREQDRKMVTRFAHAVESEVRKQTGAVPLTDEQIDQAIAELGLNYLADAHATNRAVLRKLCHHAHDIKGGQHGADT